jgi:hypothetical protein
MGFLKGGGQKLEYKNEIYIKKQQEKLIQTGFVWLKNRSSGGFL